MEEGMEMIQTENPTPAETRERLAEMLNAMLANSLDLYSHAKQAHWNVRGPQFERIHELFDTVSQKALQAADEIAERAGQLGAGVSGTLAEAAKSSQMPRYQLHIASAEEHIAALVKTLRGFCEASRKALKMSEDNHEPVTADIFVELGREMEKLLWFVESHIVSITPEAPKSTRNGPSMDSSLRIRPQL